MIDIEFFVTDPADLEGVPCEDCGRFCRQQCEIISPLTADMINEIREQMVKMLDNFINQS